MTKVKTYSRARAAIAAAKKALDGIAPFIVDIKGYEAEAGRYTAAIELVTAADRTIIDEVISKGFTIWHDDTIQTHNESPAPVDALEDDAEKGAAAESKTPRKGSGYIRGRSAAETPVALAWSVYSEMPEGTRRKDMIAAAIAAGVTFGTARTQYQKWFEKNKNT